MTTAIRLLAWVATAGPCGVSSGAVAQWARQAGLSSTVARKAAERLHTRGLVAVEHTGYRTTGQAVRLYRITDRGQLVLGVGPLHTAESQQTRRSA